MKDLYQHEEFILDNRTREIFEFHPKFHTFLFVASTDGRDIDEMIESFRKENSASRNAWVDCGSPLV